MITVIIICFAVGAAAKLLMPGRDYGGFLTTILQRIVDSAVAGFQERSLSWRQYGPAELVRAGIGAILLLFGFRIAAGKRI